MPQNSRNAYQNTDGFTFFSLLFAFIVGVVLFLWFFERPFVVGLIYLIDLPQYLFLHYIHCLNTHGENIGHYIYKVLYDHSINRIDINSVSIAEIISVQADIGQRLFWVYGLLNFYVFYRVKSEMKGGGLRHIFSIKPKGKNETSFIEYQARHFPISGGAINYDPESPDKRLLPPITPFNFMLKHNIRFNRTEGMDKDALTRLFKDQIGSRWRGFSKEPFYRQALLLIFAVNLQYPLRKGKFGSEILNNEIASAFYMGGNEGDIKRRVEGIIKTYIEHEPRIVPFINDFINKRFAYSRTACVGLLGYSGPFKNWGGGGSKMLPPVTFQWLLKWDRQLMLALHAVGSRGVKVYIEAAGIISHYLGEYAASEPLYDHMVEMAVEAVEPYLTTELIGSGAVFDMEKAKQELKRRKKGF